MSVSLGAQDLLSYFGLPINVYLVDCLHLVKCIPPKVFPCIYSILDNNKAMSKLLSFPEGEKNPKQLNSHCPVCREIFWCDILNSYSITLATTTLDEAYLKIWHLFRNRPFFSSVIASMGKTRKKCKTAVKQKTYSGMEWLLYVQYVIGK